MVTEFIFIMCYKGTPFVMVTHEKSNYSITECNKSDL
jgi:hypothetical protein